MAAAIICKSSPFKSMTDDLYLIIVLSSILLYFSCSAFDKSVKRVGCSIHLSTCQQIKSSSIRYSGVARKCCNSIGIILLTTLNTLSYRL